MDNNIYNYNTIKISACLIAKDEEKMLTECLESIKNVVDEIILVDTGSQDSTVSIALKYGCRVISSPWRGDFSQARNVAISMAKYPYILSIDADERLINPELLKPTIFHSIDTTGGWLIQVTSEARRVDGGVDTYISNLLRLFRNHPLIRFNGLIHEQILEPILNAGFKLEDTQLKMIHFGYSYSVDKMKLKQLRNLDLLNKALLRNPQDPYCLYHKAKTLLTLGDLQGAEAETKKVFEYVDRQSAVKPQALNYGAIISSRLGDYNTAIERAEQSLAIIPNQSFAHFIIGESYSLLGKWDLALVAYKQMEKAQDEADVISHIVGDYYLPPEQINFNIGKCYIGLNNTNEAEKYFEKGININNKSINCFIGLANVEFKRNNFVKSEQYLKTALELDPQRGELRVFLKQLKLAEEQFNKTKTTNVFIYDSNNLTGKLDYFEQTSPMNIDSKTIQNEELIIKKLENIDPETVNQNNNKLYTEDFTKSNLIKKESQSPLISVSMIVKDEEKYLSGCLDSIKNIADEIIIVDTGSTDKTLDIAKEYNAKIFHFEWINDFAAARNEALKHCSSEWILYIDADERLTADSQNIIRNLVNCAPEKMGAYICTIESQHLQLDGNTELHRGGYPRLFRNYQYPYIYFRGRVHEQITPSIFAMGKTVDFSTIIITHLGYDQSREVMDKKVRRNYKMLIDHVKEEPLNAYAWYQLGQTLAQMKLVSEAESAIKFSVDLGSLSKPVFASAAATLSQLTGIQKRYEDALFWSKKSLEFAPDQVYALYLKAYSLMYLNKFEESEKTFIMVLDRVRNSMGVPRTGFDIAIPEDKVMIGLEDCRQRKTTLD